MRKEGKILGKEKLITLWNVETSCEKCCSLEVMVNDHGRGQLVGAESTQERSTEMKFR